MSNEYDIIIIGGGGAGLTAALYSARANFKTLLFEKTVFGGQIAKTGLVENFPGFPDGVTGFDIAMKMEEQAKKYGALMLHQEVTKLSKDGERFSVVTDEGLFYSKAVILAMGANFRMLDVRGEIEYTGKGVSYCAMCDAPFFRNKTVVVVGGGNAAIQEALFLTEFVKQLYVVHRRDELRAGHVLGERAKKNEKIDFIWDSVITEIKGGSTVEKVIVKNVKTEKVQEIATDGVFIFIGHDPASGLVEGVIDCADGGYVKTDDRLQTSLAGVFACGEIRSGATWQLVAACGEGCQAALSVQEYLGEIKNKQMV